MQFQGTIQFAARQTAVWHTLITPTLVSQCTPHLKSWSELSTNNQYHLQFSWGSGSSGVSIPLLLTWQTVIPPNQLQWQGEAQMGSALILINGSFHLSAPTPTATTLAFTAELDAPNKLLQQMLQTTAPRLLENFFRCLKTNAEAV